MKIKLRAKTIEKGSNANEFLEEWAVTYIHQELLRKEGADDLYSQCVWDAQNEGINEQKLKEAAGGNLAQYLRLAARLAQLLRTRLAFHNQIGS